MVGKSERFSWEEQMAHKLSTTEKEPAKGISSLLADFAVLGLSQIWHIRPIFSKWNTDQQGSYTWSSSHLYMHVHVCLIQNQLALTH